ncbi:hypothetical protein D3C76_96810 [compost metagenome]
MIAEIILMLQHPGNYISNNLQIMMRMFMHALPRPEFIVVMGKQSPKVRIAWIIIIGKRKAELTVYPFSIRSMALC